MFKRKFDKDYKDE